MQKYIGSCHCGKNNFELNSEPEFQFVCYCHGCRKLNSGGHLCGIMFDQDQLVAAQHTQTYQYGGGSGKPIILHFCPACSAQLYAYPTNYPGKVVVRANTLEGGEFKPQQNLFTESAFAWDKPA